MKHWMFGFALLGMTAVPAIAQAEGLSFNYAEAGYGIIKIDDGGFSADGGGFLADASYEPVENVHVVASVVSASVDANGMPISADITGYSIGAGYHMPIEGVGKPLVVGATITYDNSQIEVTGFPKETDDGYTASAGARAMVTDVVEVNAGFAHSDSGGDTSNNVSLGGVYNFTPQVAGVVGLGHSSTTDTYSFGVRFNF